MIGVNLMPELKSYSMSFNGELLQRGFWLYIWVITSTTNEKKYLYVGRTGDSSSPHAASPFQRIGQHLDSRANAKANSLSRLLESNKLNPFDCHFKMVAIGPIFPEQDDMEHHSPHRDTVAALEFKLASYLAERFNIIGTHGSKKELDPLLWESVQKVVDDKIHQGEFS